MVPNDLTVLNFPITTPEAEKFWGSKHKSNKVKAIIAFSLSEENANDNLRRYGYTYLYRQRALKHYGMYIGMHEMLNIPFSELKDPWWEFT